MHRRATVRQRFRLPGMLHGRVIRPPAVGAKLISVDEASVHAIPDVRVVRIQDFLGVVAKNEWAAVRARANSSGEMERLAGAAW